MLIASCLAASALLVSAALAARPLVTTPPVVVGVTVVSHISPTQVARVLREAADIWRAAGVDVVWQRNDGTVAAKPSVLVTIGNWRGKGMSVDKTMPLGWIVFTDGAPEHEIYVSYTQRGAAARRVAGQPADQPDTARGTGNDAGARHGTRDGARARPLPARVHRA